MPDSQRAVMAVHVAEMIGYTAGGMAAVVAIGRLLLGYARSD